MDWRGKGGSGLGDEREADSSNCQRASKDALKNQRLLQKGTAYSGSNWLSYDHLSIKKKMIIQVRTIKSPES